MRECLEVLPAKLERAEGILAKIREDLPRAKTVAEMEELPFDNKRLHFLVTQAVANFKKGDDKPITVGNIGGFEISVKAEEITTGFTLDSFSSELVAKFTVKGALDYTCEAGRNETDNNVVRLKNVFASIIPKREPTVVEDVERLTANIAQAKEQMDVPFEYADKIAELEKTLEEVDDRLSGVTKQEDVIGDSEEIAEDAPEFGCQSHDNDEHDDGEPDIEQSQQKGRVA